MIWEDGNTTMYILYCRVAELVGGKHVLCKRYALCIM